MPVNGIGSPSSVRPQQPTSAPSATTPTPAAPPPQGGWQAGNGGQRQVDTSVGAPTVSAADVQATLPNPVRQQLEAALNTYTARLEKCWKQLAGPMTEAAKKSETRTGRLNLCAAMASHADDPQVKAVCADAR